MVAAVLSAASPSSDLSDNYRTTSEDRNKFVRMNAAMALTWSGTRRSLLALRAAYRREAQPDVKDVFDQAIGDLEKRIR